LTGNAGDPVVDPNHDIPQLVVVNGDRTVNFRVPRNRNVRGVETDKGYVIYGLSGPQGQLSLTTVDHVIPGGQPTAATNGTTRLSAIDVITGDSFQVRLDTNAVNLLGFYRDHDADGDNALFKIDDGVDVTGRGFVSTTPGNVSYGFQQFTGLHSPGYFNADGNGHYAQTLNTSGLSEGMHYVTVRVFRHRADGGPPVFTDFRQAIYIDHTPPVVTLVSFDPFVPGVNENRRATVRSVDQTANSVHVFLDLPAGLTDAQVLALVGSASQATQIDRDLFTKDFTGLTSGNHVITVVAYEISGNYRIQRFPGLFTSTIFGAGLGDLDFNGHIDANDVNLFGQVLTSNNSLFNAAADLNGDGLVNNTDLLLLYPLLVSGGADAATLAAYNQLLGPTPGGYSITVGDPVTLTVDRPSIDTPPLTFSWDLNNDGVFDDVTGAGTTVSWAQLADFGINDMGTYVITLRVSEGSTTVDFVTSITVTGGGGGRRPPAPGGSGSPPRKGSTPLADNSGLLLDLLLRGGNSASTRSGFWGEGQKPSGGDGWPIVGRPSAAPPVGEAWPSGNRLSPRTWRTDWITVLAAGVWELQLQQSLLGADQYFAQLGVG
jgi:hypothetical protein